jgi:hypothetical protein
MSRKSRLRSKATYHYKPEDVALRQNSEQPIEPVSTPVVPEKIRDSNALLPAAQAKQQTPVAPEILSGKKGQGYYGKIRDFK